MPVDVIPVPEIGIFPLTPAQHGAWATQKLGSGDIVCKIAETFEIKGHVDVRLLHRALHRVADEIEPPRTTIVERDGRPCQLVHSSFTGSIPVIDFGEEADPVGCAMHWMMQELLTPLDLEHDALWLSVIFKAGPDRVFWYHRCHHIIGDGFAAALVAHRVAAIYSAFLNGQEPAPNRFGSFSRQIEDEHRYRGSSAIVSDREYWKRQLVDLPAPVSLTRRRVPSWGGLLRSTAYLPAACTARFQEAVRGLNVTLPQILTAVVAAYFHRESGANDLVVKMPVSARMGREMRTVPGMVANAVPLRIRFTPRTTLLDLVAQVGRSMRAALRHQRYRYEDLRQDLGLISPSQQICALGINIEPFDYALRFGDCETTVHNLCNGSVDDLVVFAYDRPDQRGIRIDFDASPALYSRQELETLQSGLLCFATGLSVSTDVPIASIQYADHVAPERERLAVTRPAPAATLPDLIAAQAAFRPDALAVMVQGDPARNLTYRALDLLGDQIALALVGRGLGAGDIVAVAEPWADTLPAFLLGILRAGAAYMLLDPDAAPEHHAKVLYDAAPAVILSNRSAGLIPDLCGIPLVSLAGFGAGGGLSTALPPPRPDATAYILYACGGRSIRPRGYDVANWNVSNFLMSAVAGLKADASDVFLAITKTGDDTRMPDISPMALFVPLVAGAKLVLASSCNRADVAVSAGLIRDTRATYMLSGGSGEYGPVPGSRTVEEQFTTLHDFGRRGRPGMAGIDFNRSGWAPLDVVRGRPPSSPARAGSPITSMSLLNLPTETLRPRLSV